MKRRTFLKTSSAGVVTLVIGCSSDDKKLTSAAPEPDTSDDPGDPKDTQAPDEIAQTKDTTKPVTDATHNLNTWLEISTANTVIIAMSKAEMGQGVNTALPMIIAEELDVPWDWVSVQLKAEMDAFHIVQAGTPITSESGSVRRQYPHLRRIGAAARAMLIAAAAKQWDVDASTLKTEAGAVINGTGDTLGYGELVEAASALDVPDDPPLKDRSEFKIIGTRASRVEVPNIVEGTHTFGMDVSVEGLKYGAIKHSPVLGGEAKNLDALDLSDSPAEHVVAVPGGVVVIANSYWSANQAAITLPIEFEVTEANKAVSSETLFADIEAALETKGKNALDEGDVAGALDKADQVIKAQYQVPFLAHACMEPMNATAHVKEDSCDIWLPTQGPVPIRNAVANALGLKNKDVTVHPTYLGTGFGRKVEPDYAVQAALASKAVGGPVKLIWSREEDIQNDYYRPAFMVNLEGGISADGDITAWNVKTAGEGVLADRGIPLPIDPLSIDGLVQLKNFMSAPMVYAIPNQRVDYVEVASPMRLGFWRSVGNSQNALFVESFLDELAHAAKRDPMTVRQELLKKDPRAHSVMMKLAEVANWGKPSVEGASQGVAFCDAFASWIGMVAEVTVNGKEVTVHKITSVLDCGQVINPDTVEAQIEGGAIYGIGSVLNNEITLKDGQIQQTNFFDYPMPKMKDCPKFVTHIMDSTEPPGGIGEVGVGPAGPAVANAIFAATGQRVRTFPILKTLNQG